MTNKSYVFLDGSKKSVTGSDAGSDVVEEEIVENGQEEQEKRYYDKSSSFFDRISCEALEKQEGYVCGTFFNLYVVKIMLQCITQNLP